jgi:hypothetical protein
MDKTLLSPLAARLTAAGLGCEGPWPIVLLHRIDKHFLSATRRCDRRTCVGCHLNHLCRIAERIHRWQMGQPSAAVYQLTIQR